MSIESSLQDLVAIALVTGVSFVFTNLDNLILAVITLGARRGKTWPVLAAMISASLMVLVVSGIAVAIGSAVDAGLLGYLGIAPIGIGLYSLFYAGRNPPLQAEEANAAGQGGSLAIWLGTATLLFANSGDTLAILLPLLVESNPASALVVAISFLVCAVAWALLARALANQPVLVRRLQSVGERLMPWVMIAVGIYILLNTATDSIA